MATHEIELINGLTIGEKVHRHAMIREATAADLIDATDESEKVIRTEEGFQLIASPTMVALNTLRRQIVKVGEYEGPLSLSELKKLSAPDLSLLQEGAEVLEAATLDKVRDRGRDSAGGE